MRTDVETSVLPLPKNGHCENEDVPRTRRMRHGAARPHIGILKGIVTVLRVVERTEKLQADELCARSVRQSSGRKRRPAHGTEATAIEQGGNLRRTEKYIVRRRHRPITEVGIVNTKKIHPWHGASLEILERFRTSTGEKESRSPRLDHREKIGTEGTDGSDLLRKIGAIEKCDKTRDVPLHEEFRNEERALKAALVRPRILVILDDNSDRNRRRRRPRRKDEAGEKLADTAQWRCFRN